LNLPTQSTCHVDNPHSHFQFFGVFFIFILHMNNKKESQ
jgi:hypothetical protein